MTDATTEVGTEDGEGRRSKKPLIIGLVLFLALGAGGFYATFSGALSFAAFLGSEEDTGEMRASEKGELDFAFVPVGEIVVPLGPSAEAQFLIFESEVEVAPDDVELFTAQLPRIRDLFNTYLRAVEARDLEQQDATLRLREHLLRRIAVVVEPLEPRDLLFTTFILK